MLTMAYDRDYQHGGPSATTTTGNMPKKTNKCRSFHFRYMELCRAKNLTPVAEIRSKNNATSLLELHCDKLGVTEWLLIIESLHFDQVLQTLSLRLRKNHGCVMEQLDTEKKAKLFKQKPAIYTKFIFTGLIEAIANCIEFNKNLKILKLEGLPLGLKYIEAIAKALASNESLKELSFQRSFIGDRGCEAICTTVKYLSGVEKIDLSDCDLGVKGAEHVANMIKMQKINRFTEGWAKSLRYRNVDVESLSGLQLISIARNPQIGDAGVQFIAEVLKDDAWVKVVDMENCGLTDRGANSILNCLDLNNALTDFSVRNNDKISKFLQRNIRDHLGKGEEERESSAEQYESGPLTGMKPLGKNKKYTQAQLFEQIHWLQEQLAFERTLRKKAEQLNEKLNLQIMSLDKTEMKTAKKIPDGFVVVRNDSLQSIIDERNDFQKLVNSVCTSPDATPRGGGMVAIHVNEEATVDIVSEKSVNVVEPRKTLKVRKVKSETKYMEISKKDANNKHESKSDHEFAEAEYKKRVHIETDIGDSSAVTNNNYKNHNMNGPSYKSTEKHTNENWINCHSNNMTFKGSEYEQYEMISEYHQNNFNEDIDNMDNMDDGNIMDGSKYLDEIDTLSLTSTRDSESSDSETLRNPPNYAVRDLSLWHRNNNVPAGEGKKPNKLTPRQMFMGAFP